MQRALLAMRQFAKQRSYHKAAVRERRRLLENIAAHRAILRLHTWSRTNKVHREAIERCRRHWVNQARRGTLRWLRSRCARNLRWQHAVQKSSRRCSQAVLRVWCSWALRIGWLRQTCDIYLRTRALPKIMFRGFQDWIALVR